MDNSIVFDTDLIQRYDKAGPRYTSYPTAVQFNADLDETVYREQAMASNAGAKPLSLYFHIPFCNTVCFYCGCNKIITNNRKRAAPYLQRLHREIAMQGALFDRHRPVNQLHWGGGTPTFISHEEMRHLMRVTAEHFQLLDDDQGEYSIEIDPREVSPESVALLRELGFNRLSMGVQDFDPLVQQAVNRIQSREVTETAIQAARAQGFRSISVDLIYGLPRQNVESFSRTLDQVIAMDPDRIAVFNYGHLPELFKVQRQINEAELPSPELKLKILKQVIEHLTVASYVYIGMDHFAKPEDELALAQQQGSLYRNFQGYSTHANCDLVAMGITAIGMVGDSYSQNLKTLDDYYQRIDAGSLPIFRGVKLSADDRLRRAVITGLLCNFTLNYRSMESEYNIVFSDYFAAELNALSRMETDGLLSLDDSGIQILPPGRLLIRNICMLFDRYLNPQWNKRFSKVI